MFKIRNGILYISDNQLKIQWISTFINYLIKDLTLLNKSLTLKIFYIFLLTEYSQMSLIIAL